MTPPPSSVPRRRPSLAAALVPALVLAVTLVVYWPALRGELVYDDLLIIGQNHLIADLGNLPHLLVSPYWDFLGGEEALQIGYWRPLTGAAHAISYALGGGEPWAFHALGIGIHLLATLVAWVLARRLSGNDWIAAGTALVFGLHPTHVESVAWISALNDPLFGLFALLALAAHLRWREHGSRGIPLAASLWFLLALGAKELGAAVLPLLAAIELGRRRTEEEPRGSFGGFHAPLRAYAPLGVAFGLYLVARMFVFSSPWGGFDRVTTHFGVGFARLATLRLELLGGLLELLVLPVDLRLFRPFRPELSLLSFDLLRALLATALAVTGGVFLWRRRIRPGLAALLIIPAGFLPVLVRVESLGSFPLSDRFLYVPVFGFGLGVCLLLFRFLPRAVAAGLVVVIAALYGIKDRERIETFHDEETLFQTAVEQTPDCPYVMWGLGRVLLDRADRLSDPKALERAFDIYHAANDLNDRAKQPGSNIFVNSRDFLQVTLGLGWCNMIEANMRGSGSYSTAITIFEQLAREIEDIMQREVEARAAGYDVVSEHLELEQVYHALGLAHLLSGDLEKAESVLRRALAFRADYPPANHALGKLYLEKGQHLVARRYFEASLARRPGSFDDRIGIARSFVEEGRMTEAEQIARALVEDFPAEPDPMVMLAGAALQRRDWREALRWVDRALVVDPDHGYAWYHKANALVMRDMGSATAIESTGAEVLEAYRTAARLLPDNFEAQYQFAAYLLQARAWEAALPHLVRAYELGTRPDLLIQLRQQLAGVPTPTPELLVALARIDGKREELDLAESWLDAALSLDADHAEALFQKGRILRRRGRHTEAVALMSHACDVLDGSYDAHTEFGAYLAELGRVEEALFHLELALTLNPRPELDPRMADASKSALRKKIEELKEDRDRVGPPVDRDG